MPVIKCFNAQCHYYETDELDHCSKPLHRIGECIDAVIRKEAPAKRRDGEAANSDRAFYVKELRSAECFCGKTKKPGRSFCYGCFKALPRDLQIDLYSRMGDGYEEAYDAAVRWLEENDR